MQIPDVILIVYDYLKQQFSDHACLSSSEKKIFTVKEILVTATKTKPNITMEPFGQLLIEMENRLDKKRQMEVNKQSREKKETEQKIERRLENLEMKLRSRTHD